MTILLLLITTISHGQQRDFELRSIKFGGLDFSTTREAITKSFGKAKNVQTNYQCGFFVNSQAGGPYYQLVYTDFNYIGSDKEKFFLQNVNFDIKGRIKINYNDKELSGKTTKDDFSKIFGDSAKEYFEKHLQENKLMLFSKKSDDGAIFTFKNGRLIRFEYWTPC
ncbi:MAG: hypothetical protein HYZ44_14545 [Bacteroidetes bacterium]|nr:hypothetical protein [Bacteroidota bacterium]